LALFEHIHLWFNKHEQLLNNRKTKMFKKLLSNLPYNPSLIGQVSFYAKRLRGEERIRRLGMVFVALAFIVQMFAFISQPQPTLAESTNDIIRGGFTTKDQAVLHCLNGSLDFYEILTYYGLGCDSISNASTVTVNSRDYSSQLDSMGRNQQGPTIYRPLTNKTNPTDEYPVDIPGAGRFWMRNLWAWDSYASSSYKMLKMTNKHGQTIFIMYSCGNIVTIGKYTPPQPPPPPPPPDVCPYKPGQQDSADQCDVCPLVPGTQITNTDNCDACPLIPGTQSTTAECKPCEASETDEDGLACTILSKAALNSTQNIENADGTVADGGDKITYTLSVKNNGKITVEDFVIEENIADILDYAEITDKNGATIDGNMLRWSATDISPDETVKRRFTIKVKDPIPRTPVSASDPGRFDLIMNNVYGNQITIKLPPDVIKTTETVTKALPNTGPGETLAAVVGFTVFASYFFARTRLFAKEMDIVRTDYATTGGY
jgi:uncharacterized repeat protein (TIGR01451 family)